MSDRSKLPPGCDWYGPQGSAAPTPVPVFHEAGGGCMANDDAYYTCSIWFPGTRFRSRGVVMGTGATAEAATAAVLTNVWELHDRLNMPPRARLRHLINESVKRNSVYSSELPEILGLFMELLLPEAEPSRRSTNPDTRR